MQKVLFAKFAGFWQIDSKNTNGEKYRQGSF